MVSAVQVAAIQQAEKKKMQDEQKERDRQEAKKREVDKKGKREQDKDVKKEALPPSAPGNGKRVRKDRLVSCIRCDMNIPSDWSLGSANPPTRRGSRSS